MHENLAEASPKIDRDLVRRWVEDLVLVKTFTGLRFQEAILRKLAELKGCDYRLAHPYEESQGIARLCRRRACIYKTSKVSI